MQWIRRRSGNCTLLSSLASFPRFCNFHHAWPRDDVGTSSERACRSCRDNDGFFFQRAGKSFRLPEIPFSRMIVFIAIASAQSGKLANHRDKMFRFAITKLFFNSNHRILSSNCVWISNCRRIDEMFCIRFYRNKIYNIWCIITISKQLFRI